MPTENHTTGIVLFAHGSAVEEANRGVHELARQIEQEGPYRYVRTAFLDVAEPDLAAAVAAAAQHGLRRLVIIPYFLTEGIHMQRDLPSLVASLRELHPHLEIEIGRSLEGHPGMVSIILERVREVTGGTQSAR